MLKEQFHKFLDIFTQWEIGSDSLVIKRPEKARGTKNERHYPEKGYTVVLSHKPHQTACEWCENQCSGRKTYSRSPGSKIWNGKCSDCGEKRHFCSGVEQEK